MGWVSDLAAQLRRIAVMDEKVDRLGAETAALARDLRDVDRRVVRIEAMIEAAQARRLR